MRGKRKGDSGTCSVCGVYGHNAMRHRESRGQQAAQYVDETGCTFAVAGEKFGITREAVRLGWVKLFGDRPSAYDEITVSKRRRVVIAAVQGKSRADIAKEAGVSVALVSRIVSARGIRVPSAWSKNDTTWDAAIAMVANGASYAEAAAEHGVSEGRLAQKSRLAGVHSTQTGRGRGNGRVRRALERIRNGESISQACRAERCARAGVSAILKHRSEAA